MFQIQDEPGHERKHTQNFVGHEGPAGLDGVRFLLSLSVWRVNSDYWDKQDTWPNKLPQSCVSFVVRTMCGLGNEPGEAVEHIKAERNHFSL